MTIHACIRGCSVARRHLDSCADDSCTGCLPRLAAFGRLCIGDHFRFARMLTDLPHVETLLRGHLGAGGAALDDGVKVRRTKGDPPAPLRLVVLDVLRDVEDVPLSWARTHAAAHGHTEPTDGLRYLRMHLASVEEAEWVAEAWRELAEIVSAAHGLVPWRPEITKLGAPCPECHCAALALYGGDDWITCRECGTAITMSTYMTWSRAVAQERASVA